MEMVEDVLCDEILPAAKAATREDAGWVSIVAIVACGTAMLFYFYEFFLRISPSVMSTELMQTYQLTPRAFGHLTALYYYVYAPMQMIVGVLLDRYGTKRLLVVAALVSSVGAYLFANGHSLVLAEVGRCLVGFGAAFAFIGVLKLITVWLKPQRFAFVSGMVLVMGMLGSLFGEVALRVLMRFDGWQLTCYWVAFIGGVIALLLCVGLQDHPRHRENLEVVSFKRFRLECFRLLRNKQMWLNALIGCLLYLPILGFSETWQIPYLSYVMDYQHVDAASAAMAVFCGCAIAAPFVGWISDTLKQRCVPITVGATLSVMLLAAILYLPEVTQPIMYGLLFLYGMTSSVYILTFAVSRDLSPAALSGTAFAITNTLITLSGVSVIVAGFAIESVWKTSVAGLNVYGLQAFQIAFMIFPAALLLAVLLSFFLTETHCKQKSIIELAEE